jgi:cyd operon protein YbgE
MALSAAIAESLNMDSQGARWISLISASLLALVILIYPIALSTNGEAPSHGPLMLLMLGICAGFVHGVGFVPQSTILKKVFSPLVAWPLMLAGVLMSYS